MTSQEWSECTDLSRMEELVLFRASKRKLQLFAVACCRRAWNALTDPTHRDLVDATERFADGSLSAEALKKVRDVVHCPDQTGWDLRRYLTMAVLHLNDGESAGFA